MKEQQQCAYMINAHILCLVNLIHMSSILNHLGHHINYKKESEKK